VDLRAMKAREVMHPGPRTIRQDALAVEAARADGAHRITSVLVVDAEGKLVRRGEHQRPDAREGDLSMATPRRSETFRPNCCWPAQGIRVAFSTSTAC
jgi:hypothetical protein